jgi:hypothetical protein
MRWSRGWLPVKVPLEQCCAVRDFLDDRGLIMNLPSLRYDYGQVPRVVLGELLGAYRDSWRREHQRATYELE